MGENDTFWIVETYNDGTGIVSVMSEDELDAMKKIEDIEDWMWESTKNLDEDDMIDRMEDHGIEHNPW